VRPTPAFDALASLPAPVVAAAALVTLLGDPLLLLALVALGHWRAPPVAAEPRRAFRTLVVLGLAAAALTLALKGLFALPRPPGAAEAGYGFPSGHALGAGAVYGGAAVAFDRLDARRRAAGAGTLVVLVALSRVVVGVHYLADVAAGAALGVGLALAAARRRRALLIAGVAGVAALALAGPRVPEAAVVAGGVGGAALAPRTDDSGPVPLRVAAPGLVAVAGLGGALTAVSLPLAALALGGGVLAWTVVALPALAKNGVWRPQNVSR
jgi:membrane-associated phospholipid phosphatase